MKTNEPTLMRRAQSILATGLVMGCVFAATAQTLPSQTNLFRMGSSYPPGTVAPYNTGGGVPAQSVITSQVYTPTNCTLKWYGMQGWYTVQGATSASGPWNPLTTVAATDFAWQTTLPIPDTTNNYSFFRLNQANNYAGSDQCGGCHGDKYTKWSGTEHSTALSVLTAIGMGNNASCIPCHTVGFGQPTGFVDALTTPNLENVGCENCHGPAGWHKNSDHDLILPAVSLDPAICGSCHQGSHHPTFEEYTNMLVSPRDGGSYGHSRTSRSGSFGCAFCHQANNRMVMIKEYYDKQAGSPHPLTLFPGTNATAWTATCATCHDPHATNQVAQLRYPTHSTNYFTMPTVTDVRTVLVTNYDGSITTNSVNMNTVVDALYNPNIQVCGQCHNGRGLRWDGTSYGLVTNMVASGPVTNTIYVDITTNATITQIFTNTVPPTTNTYTYTYVIGRYATNVVTLTQTNPVVGVGIYAPLIAYTNGGIVYYTTNSSGFSNPHLNLQYNVLIGMANDDYAAAGVPNKTHAHTSAPDQCITCHVPNYALNAGTNVTGHTFALDYNGCLTSCHSSYTPDALTAKIKNIQSIETNNIIRVLSLMNQWALTQTKGTLLTNYGPLAWEFPSIGGLSKRVTNNGVIYASGPPSAYKPALGTFPSGTNDNLQLALVPQDIRMARFDLYVVNNDRSLGVHNPTYVQALLDDATTRVTRQFAYANFSANTVAGFAPLTVKFSNLGTTGSITGYSWNYGDGNSDVVANPTHVYNNPGTYAVTFTATTASGSESLVKTNYIRVLTPPALSFVADQTNVTVGTTVNFTNTSSGAGDVFRLTWYPRYGVSGAASYDTSGNVSVFSYTYTNTGTFSVSLRATCPGGASGSYNRIQVTNTAYITVY